MKYKKGQVLKNGDYEITILKVFEEGFYAFKYEDGIIGFMADKRLDELGFTLDTPKAPPNDTLVEVRHRENEDWIKRYSTGEFDSDGWLDCWIEGKTSKTTDGTKSTWKYWRLCND